MNTHPVEHWCGLKKPPCASLAGMPAAPVHSGSSLLAAWVRLYYGWAGTRADLGLWGHRCKHAVQPHMLGMHRSLMGLLSFKVWEINWIWSEGVRKVPWWSRTSHVSAFNICENLIFMIRDIYFIMQFMQNIFVCVCVCILTDLRVMEGKNPLTTRWISCDRWDSLKSSSRAFLLPRP